MTWWNHLKPQIEETLQELCFRGYYADDVQAILNSDNWLQHEIFKKERYNYESAEFTLQGLCDTFSFFTSDFSGGDVIKVSLQLHIRDLLEQSEFQRTIEELEEEVA